MRKDLVAMAVLACCANLKAQKIPKAKLKKRQI
ncbi:Uncharacterised protein [Actinobacillus lignieresii]|nr:Uncharacterised protein [Actinobacillus lignieresii]